MPTSTIYAIFRRWRERRQRKAAVRELRALSDRTLKDMGLTRGEIVAAVHGRVHRGEQVRPDHPDAPPPPAPEPARVEALDAAALQRHLSRAHQLRAEFMAALLRSGLSGIVRLLRRAVSAPWTSKRKCRPTCGGLAPDRLFGRAGAARNPAGDRAP